MQRPSAAVIKAKRAEIARKYAQKKRKVSMASLRMKDLQALLRARYPNGITDDQPGKDFVVIMAHHLAALPRNPSRTIASFVEQHAPWMTVGDTKELITQTFAKPQRWKADTLAWRLRLNDQDRSALRITTIGAIDLSKEQRQARRKAQSAERSRKWREARKRIATVAERSI